MKKGFATLQLVLGTVALLCLGVAYAWSIFVSPLEADFGWTRSQTSMIFTVTMFCFYIGNIAAGFISSKLTCRPILLTSAVLFLAGFFLASNTKTLFQIYISYGIFCGFATGIAYNNVLKTVNSWWQHAIGKSSGIMLMGFGSGSMVLGTVVTMIITNQGWSSAFRILGILFAVLLGILAFVLKDAPKKMTSGQAVKKKTYGDYSTGKMMKMPHAYFYFFWGSMIIAVGLAVVGHAASSVREMVDSASVAALYTGILGVSNGGGRVVFGILYDKIGYEKSSVIISVINIVAVAVTTLACAMASPAVLLVGFILVGVSFGGSVPCLSAYTKEFFGTKYYGSNLGVMVADGIPSTFLGPALMGALYGATASYTVCFGVMGLWSIAAMILILLCIKSTKKLSAMS